MDTKKIIKYMGDPCLMGDKEYKELKEVLNKFPFFQTAHLLFVHVACRVNHKEADSFIDKSAVFVSDRRILRNVVKEEDKIILAEQIVPVKEKNIEKKEPKITDTNKTSIVPPVTENKATQIDKKVDIPPVTENKATQIDKKVDIPPVKENKKTQIDKKVDIPPVTENKATQIDKKVDIPPVTENKISKTKTLKDNPNLADNILMKIKMLEKQEKNKIEGTKGNKLLITVGKSTKVEVEKYASDSTRRKKTSRTTTYTKVTKDEKGNKKEETVNKKQPKGKEVVTINEKSENKKNDTVKKTPEIKLSEEKTIVVPKEPVVKKEIEEKTIVVPKEPVVKKEIEEKTIVVPKELVVKKEIEEKAIIIPKEPIVKKETEEKTIIVPKEPVKNINKNTLINLQVTKTNKNIVTPKEPINIKSEKEIEKKEDGEKTPVVHEKPEINIKKEKTAENLSQNKPENKVLNTVLEKINAYKQKHKKEETKLINKFIETEPRLDVKKESELEGNIAKDSVAEKEGVITELMANIYFNQGYYDKSIEVYKKLILKNPEKKDYFANKIKEIEEIS